MQCVNQTLNKKNLKMARNFGTRGRREGVKGECIGHRNGLSGPASCTTIARTRLLSRIRHLETQNARLEQLVITDELTGVYNRRYFNQSVRRMSARQTHGRSFAFCLFDVDNFKAYNDTYGHAAGDAALRLIAQETTNLLRRDRDFLCRLGGDEFSMVLAVESVHEALGVVERVRRNVRDVKLPAAHRQTLAISVGMVWHDGLGSMPAPDLLYSEADRLLYQAKQGGGDRTTIASI